MKKKWMLTVLGATILYLGSGFMGGAKITTVHAKEGVDELWGSPVFVYGESLSEQQRLDTKGIFGIERLAVDEVSVNGQDLVKYVGSGNPNANMYSSAFINKGKTGGGVSVQIIGTENITGVTTTQYANALITAGAEDVDVKVASAVKVSGHSALTGIYKAYETQGAVLDADRMEVAQEELSVSTMITKENVGAEGFDEELLTQALITIKTELANLKEQKGDDVTEEDIVTVVNRSLQDSEIDGIITADQVSSLVGFAGKYINTDAIDSEAVKAQLGNLTSQVAGNLKEKAGQLGGMAKDMVQSEGFWDGIKNFFASLFDGIKGFFVKSETSEIIEVEDGEQGEVGHLVETKEE